MKNARPGRALVGQAFRVEQMKFSAAMELQWGQRPRRYLNHHELGEAERDFENRGGFLVCQTDENSDELLAVKVPLSWPFAMLVVD
jgi:hypothetical protein